jgi:hypothetical protein
MEEFLRKARALYPGLPDVLLICLYLNGKIQEMHNKLLHKLEKILHTIQYISW